MTYKVTAKVTEIIEADSKEKAEDKLLDMLYVATDNYNVSTWMDITAIITEVI
jgi:hypothetical protein